MTYTNALYLYHISFIVGRGLFKERPFSGCQMINTLDKSFHALASTHAWLK
jgi:hypothetical protein